MEENLTPFPKSAVAPNSPTITSPYIHWATINYILQSPDFKDNYTALLAYLLLYQYSRAVGEYTIIDYEYAIETLTKKLGLVEQDVIDIFQELGSSQLVVEYDAQGIHALHINTPDIGADAVGLYQDVIHHFRTLEHKLEEMELAHESKIFLLGGRVAREKVAENLFKNTTFNDDQVADFVGLTLESVQQLRTAYNERKKLE